MAYISLSAFAAAILPKVLASATIGGKKSAVERRQCLSSRRYAAASSDEQNPTSKFLSFKLLIPLRISLSSPGAILVPQPPPVLKSKSEGRFSINSPLLSCKIGSDSISCV